MNHLTRCRSFAFVIALVAALAGCGGGGSSSSSGASALSLNGVAATGQPIANGTVSAKCSTGSGSATTAANGSWSMSIAGGVAPCVIEITVGATKLHSYATASGVINISQVTEEILRLALGGVTPTAFFANPTFASLTAAQLQVAETAVRADLANRGIDITALSGTSSVLTLSFVANGTGVDHILDLAGPAYTVQSLQISLTVSGAGAVVSSPAGISCGGGSCTGTFLVNQAVTLTATPTLGNSVSSWGGDCAGIGTLGASGTCALTMNASKSVSATFTGVSIPTAALTVTASGLGAVTSSAGGIVACSANTCTETDPVGTAVTLTATSTAGNTIAAWGGDCTGIGTLGTTGTCALTLSAGRTATVSFTPLYSLATSISSGSGTITSNVGGINCPGTCTTGVTLAAGTAVTLTATSASGFQITNWGGDCAGIGTLGATGTCAVPAMNPNRTASVTFTALITLSVATAGPGASVVTSSPAGINCGNGNVACSAQFLTGSAVTLTESNPVNETFTNWTLGTGNATGCTGTTTTTCAFTLATTTSVHANFSAAPVGQLNVSVAGGGKVESTGGVTDLVNCTNAGGGLGVCVGIYNTGGPVDLTATPAGGYVFAGWFTNTVSGGGNAVGGTCTSTTTPCTFNKVGATQYLTAIFTPIAVGPNPYAIYTDITSGPTSGGEGNNGIYLSVFGKNFGSTGLGTTVKVYLDNIEVAGFKNSFTTAVPGIGASRGRTDIQQITAQVGAVGGAVNGSNLPIKVVADGRASNTNLNFKPNPGNIYFVSLSGNDTTGVAGNIALPFRTVQLPGVNNNAAGCAIAGGMQAIGTAGVWGLVRPGDFIVMRGGTWTDVGRDNYFLRVINKAGLPPTGAVDTGAIAIMGYPGEDAFINRPNPGSGGSLGGGSGIAGGAIGGPDTARHNNGCGAWITIANLRMEAGLDDGPLNVQLGSGNVAAQTTGQMFRIVNNEMTAATCNLNNNCKAGGISGAGFNNFWFGNYIHDIDDMPGNGTDMENHGFYLDSDGSYEIAYNRVENILGGNGFQTFGSSGTFTVNNVSFHHNIINGSVKHGINVVGGSTAGFEIYNNVVMNTAQAGIHLNSGTLVGAKFYNNSFFRSDTLNLGAPRAMLQNDSALATSNEFRNNIFVPGSPSRSYAAGSVGFPAGFGTFSNNVWFNGTGTILGTSNVTTDPKYVSIAVGAEDLHLQTGSPAIDVGTPAVSSVVIDDNDIATAALTRTLRPIGAGYDIGAFEQ